MYLGEKQQSEAVRFHLTLDTAPTGTPQVKVEKQGAEILAADDMTVGASNLEWYYAYTTGGAATVGAYQVKYSAVIDGVTRYSYDSYDVSLVDIDDIPTVEEIDTELTTEHGAGDWTTAGAGAGARAIIFNIKDGDTNNLEGVNVSVHNSSDDDAPQYAIGQTDTDGNSPTFNLDDATYKVRLSKAGAITSETETVIVTESATHNLTVAAIVVSNPVDPDVCRLRIYPITLGNADITNLADNLIISSHEALMKVEGQFISNVTATFTYDSATTPDSYYFDAVRGSTVYLKCDILGIGTNFDVPDLATKDITDLVS